MKSKSDIKIGILGGTFDPIHLGHIETAKTLIKLRKLDKLIFVPCNISPHKLDKSSTFSDGTHNFK